MVEQTTHHVSIMEWWRPVIDVLVLFALAAPPSFLEVYVEPYHRGFYCDDQSLRYPVLAETVPNIMLYTLGGGIPTILIIMVEALRLFYFERRRYGAKVFKPSFLFCGHSVNPFFSRLYYFLGYFALGSAATVSITSFGKYSVGRLRPHFVTACQPDWDQLQCDGGGDGPRFIYNPQCQGDELVVREARLSWPSGHSSFGMFSMLYAAVYLWARGAEFLDYLLIPVLQFFLATLGFLCALSRISNYRHHPLDVFSGSVLGIFMALVVTLAIGRFHRLPKFISQFQYFRVRMEAPHRTGSGDVGPAPGDDGPGGATVIAVGGGPRGGGGPGGDAGRAGEAVEAYIQYVNEERQDVDNGFDGQFINKQMSPGGGGNAYPGSRSPHVTPL